MLETTAVVGVAVCAGRVSALIGSATKDSALPGTVAFTPTKNHVNPGPTPVALTVIV